MHGENEVVQLYLDDIIPNRFQPREVFDEKALKELAVSIKEHGVIQPIIVRNIGNKYEIIAGERRYKASALAGLTKIPAIVRNLDDKESSKVALLENLQRKNLNPMEEARTYQKILEIDQMTQEELAKTMGKSQGAVANKLRLLSLSEAVQDALLKEQISERHARTLLNISDKEKQKEMLKKVIAEKMTVRELEQEINPQKIPQASPSKESTVTIPETVSPLISPVPTPPIDASSDAIDYSTPPKFIDYGVDEEEEVEPDSFESSALTPPDINALRQNAQDIHMDTAPNADLDSLLNIQTEEEKKKEEPPTQNYKFFNPNPEESTPSNFSTNEIQENFFQTPDLIQTPTQENSLSDLPNFEIPSGSSENNLSSVQEEPVYNVDSLLNTPMIQKENSTKPSSTMAIEKVREVVKELQSQGVSVEIDEMDFDKNYQMIIKFMKEE